MAYFDKNPYARRKIHHYLIGLLIILVVSILGIIAFAVTFFWVSEIPTISSKLGNLDDDRSYISYAFLFSTFIPILFSLYVCQIFWHKDSWASLLSVHQKFRWNLFYMGTCAGILVLAINGITRVLMSSDLQHVKWVYSADSYWNFLLISLLLIPLQVLAEEIFFRGYLNRFIYKITGTVTITYIITSLMFASLHLFNNEVNYTVWKYLLVLFSFGITTSVLVHISDGIELAVAYHLAGNLFAVAILGYDVSEMPTSYLWQLGKPVLSWIDVAIFLITNIFMLVMAKKSIKYLQNRS